MTGKYDIEVFNNKEHYFLTVKQKITILQGDSATGKSELVSLIGEYAALGDSSGITLKCAVQCSVLTPDNWEMRLSLMKGRIVFIDETAPFLKSKQFAECVRESDNYFVIITREKLKELPYSAENIYGLREADSSKCKGSELVYNEIYPLYGKR